MAIIRIKRTTTSTLPTGLTFGELAFVQGTGLTANRLYIADNTGVCVWIGAQILDAPEYWSGITAQTTIPTVSAVETRISSRISAGSVTSYNGLGGAVQGVSAMGSTSADGWQKLAVSFTNSATQFGATGFVNVLGATWETNTVTNAGTVGGIANGTNLQGKSVFEILQQLLFSYQNVSLSAFSITSGTFNTGTQELGFTAAASGNYTFSWTATNFSNIDSNGMSISGIGSGQIPNQTIMGATGYATPLTSGRVGSLSAPIRGITIGSSFTIRANASQWTAYQNAGGSSIPTNISTGATATRDIGTVTFYSKAYFGYTTGASITGPQSLVSTGMGQSERFITDTSTGFRFANSAGTSLAFTPSAGGGSQPKYLYVLVHDYYTTMNNWTDITSGFNFGMTGNNAASLGSTLTVQNAQGFTAFYKVYRSKEATNTSYVAIWSS